MQMGQRGDLLTMLFGNRQPLNAIGNHLLINLLHPICVEDKFAKAHFNGDLPVTCQAEV